MGRKQCLLFLPPLFACLRLLCLSLASVASDSIARRRDAPAALTELRWHPRFLCWPAEGCCYTSPGEGALAERWRNAMVSLLRPAWLCSVGRLLQPLSSPLTCAPTSHTPLAFSEIPEPIEPLPSSTTDPSRGPHHGMGRISPVKIQPLLTSQRHRVRIRYLPQAPRPARHFIWLQPLGYCPSSQHQRRVHHSCR